MIENKRIYRCFINILFPLCAFMYLYMTYVNIDIDYQARVSVNRFIFILLLAVFLLKILYSLRIRKEEIFSLLVLSSFLSLKVIYGDNFSVEYNTLIFLIAGYLLRANNTDLLIALIASKVLLLISTIVLSNLGYLDSNIIVKQDQSLVYSYGFKHTNGLGSLALSIIIDVALFIRKKRNNIFFFITLCFFSSFIFYISRSKTSLILSILIIFVIFLNNFLFDFFDKSINKNFFSVILMIILIASISLPYFYQEGVYIWDELNRIFTLRLFLGNFYINEYGIGYFPQHIEQLYLKREFDVVPYYNDNTFLSIILSSGIIIFLLLNIFLLYKQRSKEYSLYVVFLVVISLVSMIFESNGYNVFLYSPLLFIFNDKVEKVK